MFAHASRFCVLMLLLQLCAAAAPAFGALLSFVEAEFDGMNGVQYLAQPSAVVVSPDWRHVYVTSTTDAAVAAFDRNATTGRLSFIEAQRNGQPGVQGLGGAAALTFSADGTNLYVAGSSDAAVAVFARDAATGHLNFVQAQMNGAGTVGLGGASSLALSADGKNLYVTGHTDDALAVFRRDAATGRLTFVEAHVNGVGGVDWLDGAIDVAVSPDGADVYVAARNQATVAMLRRNANTGTLLFNGQLVEGVNGLRGLARPNALALTANGQYVYVASFDEDITVFVRDPATGLLSFIQNDNVLPGGPVALTVSPDGARVYVASYVSSTRSELNVFTRAANGTVASQETYADGANAQGVNGASAVVVSPDNRHVYVTGRSDNALAVFAINATLGPTPTPTAPVCTGDCNHDGEVTVNELLTMINIALGNAGVSTCTAGDANGHGRVTVDEILTAVSNALNGCDVHTSP
jgi:6-phosphogluconolactonase (cycloisomerase 2 family)